MPKARNRFERSNQVLAWLKHEWPCGRPVRLRWRKEIKANGEQYFGETWRDGRSLVIDLSRRRNRHWATMVETICHEWSHAVLWGSATIEHNPKCNDHSPAFWAQYGEIIDRWSHDGGAEQANEFGVS